MEKSGNQEKERQWPGFTSDKGKCVGGRSIGPPCSCPLKYYDKDEMIQMKIEYFKDYDALQSKVTWVKLKNAGFINA